MVRTLSFGACRCRQLHMVLPDFLPKYWLKVVSQPWEGDVTMVLPSMVWQIKKAISNPTPAELHDAVKLVRVSSVAMPKPAVFYKHGWSDSIDTLTSSFSL